MKTEILCAIVLGSAIALAACASAPTATPVPTAVPPTATAVPPTATALSPTKTPTPLPTATLPPLEKPDDVTFRAHFNELYLTNAQPATVFNVGDKICPVLDTKREMQGSISVFDAIKRTEIAFSEFRPDRASIFQFCRPFGSQFALGPGKYEYKVRVGNQLVAVLPAQVQPSETGTPALSEQPNAELFREYVNSAYISNMRPTTVFTTADRFAVYVDVKKDMPALSGGFYDVNRQAYLLAQKLTILTSPKPDIYVAFLPIGVGVLIPGKYEFRFWVGEPLVAVLPFEVR